MYIELSKNIKTNYLGIDEYCEDILVNQFDDLNSLFLVRLLMLSKKYNFISFDEFANKMEEYNSPLSDESNLEDDVYGFWNLIYSINTYVNLSNNRTFITYNDELSDFFHQVDWVDKNSIVLGEQGIQKYHDYTFFFYDNIQMFKQNQEGKWIDSITFVTELTHMVESSIINDIVDLFYDEAIEIDWFEIYDSGIIDDSNFVIKNNFDNLLNVDNIRNILNEELSEFDKLTTFYLNKNAILEYFDK